MCCNNLAVPSGLQSEPLCQEAVDMPGGEGDKDLVL